MRQRLFTTLLALLTLVICLMVYSLIIKPPQIASVEELKTLKIDQLIELDKASTLTVTLVEKDGDKFYVPENLDTSSATISAQAVRVTFEPNRVGIKHPPREFVLIEYTLEAQPWIREELGYCPCEAEVYDRDDVLQLKVREILNTPNDVSFE